MYCMYEQPHQPNKKRRAQARMHLHFSLIIGWLLTLVRIRVCRREGFFDSYLSLWCASHRLGLVMLRYVGRWVGGAAGGKAGNFVLAGGFFWVDGWMP